MKYLLFVLSVTASIYSYGQISLQDMIDVSKMDLDKFESFVLKRGYRFEKTTNNEHVFGATYTKGVGINTKYLSFYTKYYNNPQAVSYQTTDEKNVLLIKDQLKKRGFRLIDTRDFEGNLVNEYVLNKWDVSIYSALDDDSGYSVYEISFETNK